MDSRSTGNNTANREHPNAQHAPPPKPNAPPNPAQTESTEGTEREELRKSMLQLEAELAKGKSHSLGPSPADAEKKMKDIVPYPPKFKKILELIGFDIADDIPDEHEEDTEFVISHRSEDADGTEGVYTGWMKKNLMHGRGTMLFDSGYRYDGMWKSGRFHGRGRFLWYDGSSATQSTYDNNGSTEGMMEFSSNGRVEKFTNGKYIVVKESSS